jgi:SEC-C motif-containing protein
MRNKPQLCPCGSKLTYDRCCALLHRGAPAQSAEMVMRARYAAYALGRVSYLLKSTHPRSPLRQADLVHWRRELQMTAEQTRFLKLDIRSVEEVSAEIAFVTFHVTAFQSGRNVSFSECSEFRCSGGRWLYFDGVVPPKAR